MIATEALVLQAKGNLVGGMWRPASDGATIPVHDPSTGDVHRVDPCEHPRGHGSSRGSGQC